MIWSWWKKRRKEKRDQRIMGRALSAVLASYDQEATLKEQSELMKRDHPDLEEEFTRLARVLIRVFTSPTNV